MCFGTTMTKNTLNFFVSVVSEETCKQIISMQFENNDASHNRNIKINNNEYN